MVLSDNEDVPQEMLDFLQLKHFHSVNKMSSSEYVFTQFNLKHASGLI